MADRPKSGDTGALALMRAIRDAEIEPPLRKLVLYTLAVYADRDGGGIHPGLRTVAERTGLDHRTVRRHVRACLDEGYLVQTRPPRQNYTAEYRLDLDALREGASVPPDELRGGAGAFRGGDDASQRGRQCAPTCNDLSPPGAPPASPALEQADGASLPESVPRSMRRDITVERDGGKVKVRAATEFIGGYLATNCRDDLAASFGVAPDAIEFTN